MLTRCWGAVLARSGGAVYVPIDSLRSGEIMKTVRVILVLVGLLTLPLVAAAAQGQSAANKCKNTPQAGQNGNSQRGAAAVAAAQAGKCPAPLSSPPTGQNMAGGVVFEDGLDPYDGSQDPFYGE